MKFKHLTTIFLICGLLEAINVFNDFPYKEEFSKTNTMIASFILLFYWLFSQFRFNQEEKLF